jgi:hypothetical protein
MYVLILLTAKGNISSSFYLGAYFNTFNRDTISIEGVSGKDGNKEVALVITDLNKELQETLLVLPDLLNAALGDGLFECDSRLEGFEVHAVHLEPGYNRYTEKVSRYHTIVGYIFSYGFS